MLAAMMAPFLALEIFRSEAPITIARAIRLLARNRLAAKFSILIGELRSAIAGALAGAAAAALAAGLAAAPICAQVTVAHKAGSGPAQRAAKVELVAQTGQSTIAACALSSDGKLLVSGSIDHTVKLWEASTGLELRTFYGHLDSVTAVSISPDGKVAASAGMDDTVRLWDVDSGQPLRIMPGQTTRSTLSYSPDGRWLVLGQFDGTVLVWDVAHFYNEQTIAADTGQITAVAISANSKWMASAGKDLKVKIWNLATGELTRTLTGHTGELTGISFSQDGKLVATSSRDQTLKIWRTDTGAQVKQVDISADDPKDSYQLNAFYSVAFNPDGNSLIAGDVSHGYVWDAQTFALRTKFDKAYILMSPLPFSADGTAFASLNVSGNSPELYDAKTGRPLLPSSGFEDSYSTMLSNLSLTPNGQGLQVGFLSSFGIWELTARSDPKRFVGHGAVLNRAGTILAYNTTREIVVWDLQNDKKLRSIANLASPVRGMDMSADAQWIVYRGNDDVTRLLDANSGKEVRTLDKNTPGRVLKFSPDGNWIASCDALEPVRVWRVPDGTEVRLNRENSYSVWCGSVAFSPDSRRLAISASDGVKLWEFASSGEVRTFSTGDFIGNLFDAVAFSPEGKTLAAVRSGYGICLFDVAAGALLKTLATPLGQPQNPVFSADGKRLFAGYNDSRIRIWDVALGQELATVAILESGDGWAIVDSKGRFDASPAGMRLLHWVVGNETIELSQLKERYYEPYLLAKLMGFNKEALRDVTAFTSVALYPEIKAMGDVDASGKLRVQLKNRGGGLGRIQVLVNDKELFADAREGNFNPKAAQATITIDLSGAPAAAGEDTPVQVIAWNQEGYLSSRPAQTVWKPAGVAEKRRPDLYAIISGISDYDAPELQLKFAAKDADNMARAMEIGGSRLFEHVHVMAFSTTSKNPELQPSKANLQRAFKEAENSQVRDVLFVYLAGHGVSRNDTYAYPTKQARTLDLSDPAILEQSAVTSEELVAWVKKVPARHQVMILDTCVAGLAAAKLVEKRGAPSEQIRALDRMRGRTGFHVLMGSAANAASYEATQFGEGLLTYSLLEGMRGAALRDGEFIDVNKLFQYAADRVPQLAQNIGGIQRPEVLAEGASFDVGELLEEDKEKIPLAVVKPVILRPTLLDADGEDSLGLMPALRKRLREESYVKGRGDTAGPAAIFVDEEEMPGGIRPSGNYTVTDKAVVVNLNLKRDDKRAKIKVEGAADDKDALVLKIFSAVLEASKTL
jgi:WD40 repeat protein